MGIQVNTFRLCIAYVTCFPLLDICDAWPNFVTKSLYKFTYNRTSHHYNPFVNMGELPSPFLCCKGYLSQIRLLMTKKSWNIHHRHGCLFLCVNMPGKQTFIYSHFWKTYVTFSLCLEILPLSMCKFLFTGNKKTLMTYFI